MDPNEIEILDQIVASGVPVEGLALFGRWWQLERWLREMAYFELRARYGAKWAAHLSPQAKSRARGDAVDYYMASADSDDLLAYADVSVLFKLIEDNWDLFSSYLPPKRRWTGATDELSDLRNRNAHCRRPHPDDLARIEQALRDVESGAWKFYASYADDHPASVEPDDPMVALWVKGQHDTARRLLRHAEINYDTRFELWYTIRPWANEVRPLSGSAGVLWKANWFLGGREIKPRELVRRVTELRQLNDLLVHLEFGVGHLTACFSAVDAAGQVADVIGSLFDAILETSGHERSEPSLEAEMVRWKRETQNLPARFQAGSAFGLADPDNAEAFTLFGA
jgi:hypothetical protein